MNDEIQSDNRIGSRGDALRREVTHQEDVVVQANKLFNNGVALLQSGRRGESEAMLREVLLLLPGNQDVGRVLCHILLQKGIELSQSGEDDKAIASLREAIRLQHDHPDVRHVLGTLLFNKAVLTFHEGCLDLAEAVLREVLYLLPEYPAAKQVLIQIWVKRAVDLSQSGLTNDALNVLREALYFLPDDQVILFMISRLTFEIGRTEEAVSLARRLMELSHDNANYVAWYGIVLNSLGDMNGTEVQICRFIDLMKSGSQASDVNPGEVLRIYGELLINKKEYDNAIAIFTELAQSGFHQTICATVIADVLLAKGALEQTLSIIAPFASSTWSRTFVTASIAQFRSTLNKMGMELPLRLSREQCIGPSISISSLSNFGRFGQQMSEYLLLYLYARKNGLVLETPEWVGHYFFDLDDPILTPYKYVTRKGQGSFLLQNILDNVVSQQITDTDVWSPGCPCDNWTPGAPHRLNMRDIVQSRLKPRHLWMPYLQPALDKLNVAGKTILAIHLRRGDRVGMNDITQTSLYLSWLAQVWPSLENPVLFLASDDIESVKNDFSFYRPLSLSDLTEPWHNNEYLQDFYILMNCDILGISTGGFAANAALLNNRARLFVCPSSDNQSIIPFSPYVL